MPTVRPVSDLQRHLTEISDECHRTRRPTYLTKNGTASLVVMDAAAFDEKFDALDRLAMHEERVARSIARGYDEMVRGEGMPLDEAWERLDALRAQRNANG